MNWFFISNLYCERNRMKIGDLVELSAYGRQRKRADWIERGDIGIITRLVQYNSGYGPDYIVNWVKSDHAKTKRWSFERANSRKDLKYVTKRK